MKTVISFYLAFLVLLLSNFSTAQKVNPDEYPSADAKEWGQLLWNMKIANQDLSDFSSFQEVNESGLSANRYTVAYSSYFLAAEQYHKFPAWSEAIQPVFDRLILRLLQKQMWQYWATESEGIAKFEPNMDKPYTPSKDPVGHANIMYSGHLLMMINLYESLYRDMKWDKPGSIVFKWDDNTQFVYDNKSLQELIAQQFLSNPIPGVECERNAIFSACNQFPLIGLKLYDELHNTRNFAAVAPLYKKWFEENFIDPETSNIAWFYLIKQKSFFSEKNPYYGNKSDSAEKKLVKEGVDFVSAGNDGAVGTFMHAWNPEIMEKIYPALKKKVFTADSKDFGKLRTDVFIPDAQYAYWACYVAEMGDESALKELFKTIDSIYSPVWVDGTYHYPYNENVSAPSIGSPDEGKKNGEEPKKVLQSQCCNTHIDKMQPPQSDVSDRVIGLARALPKNGMYNMVNKPFDEKHFSEPSISGVDITKVILKRAIYDSEKKALIISTLPQNTGGVSGFKVIRLDPAKSYELFVNKDKKETIKGKSELSVSIEISKANDIILQEINKE